MTSTKAIIEVGRERKNGPALNDSCFAARLSLPQSLAVTTSSVWRQRLEVGRAVKYLKLGMDRNFLKLYTLG